MSTDPCTRCNDTPQDEEDFRAWRQPAEQHGITPGPGRIGFWHPARRGLLRLGGVGGGPGYVGFEQRATYVGDIHNAD